METEKKSNIGKILSYILGSLILTFMIYYAVMAGLSPVHKIAEINSLYGYKAPENTQTVERIFSDSAFITLNREKSFYQARVLMAESDSISLALNIPDSTAMLEINGVMVHRSKLSEISVSKVFSKADEYSVSSMLAIPFTVENDFATLKKEPVMIKTAPKDTSEYVPDILPDTAKSEPVNYMFQMENGIRIYIYQEADREEGGTLRRFLFDMNERFRSVADNMHSIIRFKVPEYHPYIRIRMPVEDAKIIYRALPKHGQVAVFR